MKFMSQFDKPLGFFIFFWIKEGLEKRVVVVANELCKGDAG